MPMSVYDDSGFAGRYELREARRGTYGTRYRAFAVAAEREVDLLLIPAKLLDFDRFFEAHRKLKGVPGIAGLLDWGFLGDLAYIVTDGRQKRTLAELLDRGEKPRNPGALVASIALVLASAHEAGVAHGNLSADCILIGDDGSLQVSDFGLGVYLGHSPLDLYRAPELRRDVLPSFQSDQYSLACVAAAVLHGEQVLEDRDSLPKRVPGFLRRCLAPDPSKRFANTLELVHTLAIEAIHATAAYESSARAAAGIESPWSTPFAPLMAGGFAIGLIWIVYQLVRSEAARPWLILGVVLILLWLLFRWGFEVLADSRDWDLHPATLHMFAAGVTVITLATTAAFFLWVRQSDMRGIKPPPLERVKSEASFNTWFEEKDVARPEPEEMLQQGEEFKVILDISHLDYRKDLGFPGVVGWKPNSEMRAAIAEARRRNRLELKMIIRPLLLGRSLEWIGGATRSIDVWKGDGWESLLLPTGSPPIMTMRLTGFDSDPIPHTSGGFAKRTAAMRLAGVRFPVRAVSEGCGVVAFSLWNEDGTVPLDQVIARIPVGAGQCPDPEETRTVSGGFAAAVMASHSLAPSAALHLFTTTAPHAREPVTVAVLAPREREEGDDCEHFSWVTMGEFGSDLRRDAADQIGDARALGDYSLIAGAILTRLFPQSGPEESQAAGRCGSGAALSRLERLAQNRGWRLFIRNVDQSGEPSFIPLSILFSPRRSAGGGTTFAHRPMILQPLRRQSYGIAERCIEEVVFVIPDRLKGHTVTEIAAADLGRLRRAGSVLRSMREFRDYTTARPAGRKPTLLLVLSHHASGDLFFEDEKQPWRIEEFTRPIAFGSAAVLAACATGGPTADHTRLVDKLNAAGVDAAVLAPYSFSAQAGARFARAFALRVADAQVKGDPVMVADLFDGAVATVIEEAKNDKPIASVVNEFFLAGNGGLRLCGSGGESPASVSSHLQ